jgi:hypothetical protein
VREEVDVVIVGVPVIHRRIPPSDGGLTMTIHSEDRRDPNREDGLYLQALRTIALNGTGQHCPRRAILCKVSRHPDRFGRTAMKSFLLACAAAIVVAAVGAVVLNRVQEPVEQAFATTGVRL